MFNVQVGWNKKPAEKGFLGNNAPAKIEGINPTKKARSKNVLNCQDQELQAICNRWPRGTICQR